MLFFLLLEENSNKYEVKHKFIKTEIYINVNLHRFKFNFFVTVSRADSAWPKFNFSCPPFPKLNLGIVKFQWIDDKSINDIFSFSLKTNSVLNGIFSKFKRKDCLDKFLVHKCIHVRYTCKQTKCIVCMFSNKTCSALRPEIQWRSYKKFTNQMNLFQQKHILSASFLLFWYFVPKVG